MPTSPELHDFCVLAGCTLLSILAINALRSWKPQHRILEYVLVTLISGAVWYHEVPPPKPEILSARTVIAALLYGLTAFASAYGLQTNAVSIANWIRLKGHGDTQSETKGPHITFWKTLTERPW